MRRVVSLYLPTWPTDRLRRSLGKHAPPADVPVVMIGRAGRKRMVLAADAAAQALRLYPGMAATQARALCAELQVHDADPAGDAEALDRLALWALKLYAPIVAADPPDGLVLDASGVAHLFGGEATLLADMVARLAAVGVSARTAMAGTWGAAHALARFVPAPATIVPSDQSGRAIAHLPTWALLPEGMADALGKMGSTPWARSKPSPAPP